MKKQIIALLDILVPYVNLVIFMVNYGKDKIMLLKVNLFALIAKK